jgi:small subunit ribosomal protein S4
VLVNGRRVDIASFRVKVGHTVAIREKSLNVDPVVQGVALAEQRRWDSAWMTVDTAARKAEIKGVPDETSVPFPIDVQLVIELYALNA